MIKVQKKLVHEIVDYFNERQYEVKIQSIPNDVIDNTIDCFIDVNIPNFYYLNFRILETFVVVSYVIKTKSTTTVDDIDENEILEDNLVFKYLDIETRGNNVVSVDLNNYFRLSDINKDFLKTIDKYFKIENEPLNKLVSLSV